MILPHKNTVTMPSLGTPHKAPQSQSFWVTEESCDHIERAHMLKTLNPLSFPYFYYLKAFIQFSPFISIIGIYWQIILITYQKKLNKICLPMTSASVMKKKNGIRFTTCPKQSENKERNIFRHQNTGSTKLWILRGKNIWGSLHDCTRLLSGSNCQATVQERETHLELSHFGELKMWRLKFRKTKTGTVCKDA